MQASKAADTYALFEGRSSEQADARQAHAQSKLGGTPTWVFLPRDEWPKEWSHMRNPVCPLYLSFHTDILIQEDIGNSIARGMLQQKALEMKLFLIIYVDDFKLSGPADKLAEGWQLLQ
eukprot:8682930-Pyramimonas_sp.AAC.1